MTGEAEKTAAMIRNTIARTDGPPHTLSLSLLAWALINSGALDEAMAISKDLPAAADATDNPQLTVLALTSYGWAYRDADPLPAYEASRRAVAIARDTGNRFVETTTILGLSRLAVKHGEPIEAIDLLVHATGNYFDSGGLGLVTGPLALIAVLLNRFGRYEQAATIMGFSDRPNTRMTFPEVESTVTHLRAVLGDATYESFARGGAAMTTPGAVAYALDRIERVRAELLDAD
jgi:hypothetical protein